jgi:hypothetical protein
MVRQPVQDAGGGQAVTLELTPKIFRDQSIPPWPEETSVRAESFRDKRKRQVNCLYSRH